MPPTCLATRRSIKGAQIQSPYTGSRHTPAAYQQPISPTDIYPSCEPAPNIITRHPRTTDKCLYVIFRDKSLDCWICGNEANSREHRFKASDVRLHIGEISQSNPLYRAPKGTQPKRIGSDQAKAFKFEKLICAECNNDTTQPYDESWEKLSAYFYKNRDRLVADGKWEPKKVFPGSCKREMLNVHLFFIKFFGCIAKENKMKLDFSVLSRNILGRRANHRFFLSFGNTPGLEKNERFALESPIRVMEQTHTKEIFVAFTFYIIGQICVEIIYMPKVGHRPSVKRAWCPTDRPQKHLGYRNVQVTM